MKKIALFVAGLGLIIPALAASNADTVARAKKLFGEGTYIFSPDDDLAKVDATVETVFKKQHHQQFGPDRYAFLFLPGDYSKMKTINVGYYTQVLGLGRSPLDVKLPNVKTPCALPNNNATCNFWVGIENVTITEKENNEDPYFAFQWAVSQAAPARRLYVERKAVFDWFYGWASGGYVADCIFKKAAGSWSQQQYYYRNSRIDGGVYGVNWNNFIQGCTGERLMASSDSNKKVLASALPTERDGVVSTWSDGGSATLVGSTEVIREKPFLFVDKDGAFKVFVPAIRRHAKGPSWSETDPGRGTSLNLEKDFYIAHAKTDTAKTLNAALAKGRNILLTPGVYHVDAPLKVTKANTIVLGIGEATIVPENPEAAIVCADVDGIILAGLIFDAERASRRFVVVGEKPTQVSHAANPTFLIDLVYRVGGTGKPGKTEACIEINSNDAVIDHTWVWRADHGDHTGWDANTSKNGIVVNGANVIGNGLFVEHFQEHDILWTGENGRTYFLQNEKCYDPKNQQAWMSHGGKKKGWAAYKVADAVKTHYAVGLGVYDVFINTGDESVRLEDAIEVPDTPGVLIENACIVELARGDGPIVGINHIVNGKGFGIRTGKGANGGYAVQRLTRYCNGKADIKPDYYLMKK
ncbi:MAG: glycoside hydrolase family 16 [Kiritimatiellia bacterium]